MKHQVLSGLPGYGELPVQFDDNLTGSEGLVIEFHPQSGTAWVGNFCGGLSTFKTLLEHPNKLYVIVIARGEGYVVNPETRELIERFGGQIEKAFQIPEKNLIIFADSTEFDGFNANGHAWRSRRISWDGFKNLSCDGQKITGGAWGLGDNWISFSLDINTGEHEGGPLID